MGKSGEQPPETVAVFLGGLGTSRELPFSASMYRPYKDLADKNRLISPHWFGFQSFNKLCKTGHEGILNLREEYNTQRLILIGHSLGGLIAMQFVIDRPDEADAIMTLGTPYANVTPKFVPFDISGNARAHIRDHLREGVSQSTEVTLVGSDKDYLVPADSALPQTIHARYRITNNADDLPPDVHHLPLEQGHSDHNGIPLHSSVIEIAQLMARETVS